MSDRTERNAGVLPHVLIIGLFTAVFVTPGFLIVAALVKRRNGLGIPMGHRSGPKNRGLARSHVFTEVQRAATPTEGPPVAPSRGAEHPLDRLTKLAELRAAGTAHGGRVRPTQGEDPR